MANIRVALVVALGLIVAGCVAAAPNSYYRNGYYQHHYYHGGYGEYHSSPYWGWHLH